MPFTKFSTGRQSGFTLIEIAIGLVIVGMLMGGALEIARVYAVQKTYKTTRANIDAINGSIALYLARFSSLPCPAPLNALQDDKEYGKGGNCEELLSTSLSTNDNYIVTQGRGNEKVIIGKLPFRDLSLVQTLTRDGWNRDFYYAVTANLTDSDTYSQYAGVIDVVDSNDVTLTHEETGVQYVIYSTGSDAAHPGTEECVPDRADSENCDGDGTFRYAPTALGPGTSYYDDIISYVTWIASPDMSEHCSIPDYISSISNTSAGEVESYAKENAQLYLNPGDMSFVCNRRMLSALNTRQCVLFVCTPTGSLRRVETIE